MTEEAGVGAELAQARQALGLSLADIAQQLKFSARQIEAVEQDRYADLPTGTFARGMVRSYARLLKLDAEPLVARIAARVAVPDNSAAVASVRHAIPITDSTRRTNLTYAAFSVAILAAIAAVVIEWQHERSRASRLTFIPAARPPAEPKQVAASLTPPQLVPMAEITATPERKPLAQGSHRLVLRFEREAWVEVRGRGGKLLLSQLNAAGSERSLEGEGPFQLIIGNAQHVRLSYDDRPVDLAPHVKVEVARLTLE